MMSELTNYYYNKKGILIRAENFNHENRKTGLSKYYYNRKGLGIKNVYR